MIGDPFVFKNYYNKKFSCLECVVFAYCNFPVPVAPFEVNETCIDRGKTQTAFGDCGNLGSFPDAASEMQ